MASPSVRSSTAPAAGLSGTSPAGTQIGDLVLVVTYERSTTGTAPVFTLQGGYEEASNGGYNEATACGRCAVAGKVATSSGATSYQAYTSNIGTNAKTGIIVITAGTFDTADLFNPNPPAAVTSTGTGAPNPPNQTGMTAGTEYLRLSIGMWIRGSAGTATLTGPSGDTQIWTETASSDLQSRATRLDVTGVTSSDPATMGDNFSPGGTVAITVCIAEPTSVSLVIADSTHVHTADALALVQQHQLTVADSTHVHAADNVVLEVVGGAVDLVIADSTHALASETLALVQQHVLAVADSTHVQSADNLTFGDASVQVTNRGVMEDTTDRGVGNPYSITPGSTPQGQVLLSIFSQTASGGINPPAVDGGGTVTWTELRPRVQEGITASRGGWVFLGTGTFDGSAITYEFDATQQGSYAVVDDVTGAHEDFPVIRQHNLPSQADADGFMSFAHQKLAHGSNAIWSLCYIGNNGAGTMAADGEMALLAHAEDGALTASMATAWVSGGCSDHSVDWTWEVDADPDSNQGIVLELQCEASEGHLAPSYRNLIQRPVGDPSGNWASAAFTPSDDAVVVVDVVAELPDSTANPSSVLDNVAGNALSQIAKVAIDSTHVIYRYAIRYTSSPGSKAIQWTQSNLVGSVYFINEWNNTDGSTNTDWCDTPVTAADDASTSLSLDAGTLAATSAVHAVFGKDSATEDFDLEDGFHNLDLEAANRVGFGHETECFLNAVIEGSQDGVVTATYGSADAAGIITEVLAASVATDLVIADSTHALTSENVTLVQQHQLTIQDAAHVHVADNLDLIQQHLLGIQDATHVQTAEGVVLVQQHLLAIADSTHAQAAETPALVQQHVLVVQDSTHGHLADNVVLTQQHQLAVQDSTHGHVADNVVLEVGITNLVISDGVHGHTAENLALVQQHVLTVADSTHAQTADNVELVQQHTLTVQDSTHGLASDNVALEVEGALAIHDSTHGHTADQLTLGPVVDLTVQDSTHALTSENVALTQVHVITIQDATHGHAAENVSLAQLYNLAIADTTHAQAAGNVVLFIGLPGVPVDDPQAGWAVEGSNIVLVDSEGRAVLLETEGMAHW